MRLLMSILTSVAPDGLNTFPTARPNTYPNRDPLRHVRQPGPIEEIIEVVCFKFFLDVSFHGFQVIVQETVSIISD